MRARVCAHCATFPTVSHPFWRTEQLFWRSVGIFLNGSINWFDVSTKFFSFQSALKQIEKKRQTQTVAESSRLDAMDLASAGTIKQALITMRTCVCKREGGILEGESVSPSTPRAHTYTRRKCIGGCRNAKRVWCENGLLLATFNRSASDKIRFRRDRDQCNRRGRGKGILCTVVDKELLLSTARQFTKA